MAADETICPFKDNVQQSHSLHLLSPSIRATPNPSTKSLRYDNSIDTSPPFFSSLLFWTTKALSIPEIVLLIQEQLLKSNCRATLCLSLRVSRLWYQTGRHLVWQSVDWDNTLTGSLQEQLMLRNLCGIKTLRCMFHSQAGTCHVDSSTLLGLLVAVAHERNTSTVVNNCNDGNNDNSITQDSMRKGLTTAAMPSTILAAVESRTSHLEFSSSGNIALNSANESPLSDLNTSGWPVPRKVKLEQLFLKGHFDLKGSTPSSTQTAYSTSSSALSVSQRLDLQIPQPLSFFAFSIPSLTRLDIRPSVSAAVDIHSILDSAVRLEHLVIYSHGSFIDSRQIINKEQRQSQIITGGLLPVKDTHCPLRSLTIHHLRISREELESVAARCPNLTEFQSVCSPGILWKDRPAQISTSTTAASLSSVPQAKSLVCAIAESCPKLRRLHIGLQQGGFHLENIHEALTTIPHLESLGIPALDCTKVTMNTIKTAQMGMQHQNRPYSMELSSNSSTTNTPPATQYHPQQMVTPLRHSSAARVIPFLTTICIMNVCSSEKVSQAIHDYLCWTPYLKEFYAYNTTLYVEQMQLSQGVEANQEQGQEAGHHATLEVNYNINENNNSGIGEYRDSVEVDTTNALHHNMLDDLQNIPGTSSSSLHTLPPVNNNCNDTSTVAATTITMAAMAIPTSNNNGNSSNSNNGPTATTPSTAPAPRQWACTKLERLVVRFAHLPWRNLSDPPRRSRHTFSFLSRLQNLKHLCIKEGLMLEVGREYEALAELNSLEELVFTTCYPIPLKPSDIEWMKVMKPRAQTRIQRQEKTTAAATIETNKGQQNNSSSYNEQLKTVVIRRQKANAILDREMTEWFQRYRPDVKFLFELTDCCEEEYNFEH